jgi:RNA polymerase sigma-70 factor (ECF subfamily)
MQRLAADDEEAMAGLVAHWQRPVLAYICRFLSCSDDEARDLAQEVFLRVWQQRRRWQPRASFSTWLFTIVSNLCRNRRRDLSRRPYLVAVETEPDGEPGLDLEAPVAADPHARAEAGELADKLRSAVGDLPEKQRAALLLRRFQAMSYREIAGILNVTPAAVDSLLVRARRRLTDLLRASERNNRPKIAKDIGSPARREKGRIARPM